MTDDCEHAVAPFTSACRRLGVRHLRTPIHAAHAAKRRHALAPWLRYCNGRRAHTALITRLEEAPA